MHKTTFDGLDDWLREQFFRHGGNADVIRQELSTEHGIVIGLDLSRICAAPGARSGCLALKGQGAFSSQC